MRRVRGNSPTGSRKRNKRSTSLPEPTQYFLCSCSECEREPDVHPETQELIQGRWVTEKELRTHAANETAALIGKSMLRSYILTPVQAPADDGADVASPSASEGISSSRSGSNSPTERSSPPSTETGPSFQPTSSSATTTLPQLLTDDVESQTSHLARSIKSAKDCFADVMVVFRCPPTRDTMINVDYLTDVEIDDVCALDEESQVNSHVIGFQQTLCRVKDFVKEQKGKQHFKPDHSQNDRTVLFRVQLENLERRLQEEQASFRRLLVEQWQFQNQVAKLPYTYDTLHHHVKAFQSLTPISLACFLLVATLYFLSGVSMDHCTFILGSLQIILKLALQSSSDILAQLTLRSIPKDVRTVVDRLQAKPRFLSYVCCPSCSKLYWVDPDSPVYPDICTNAEVDQPACGAKLAQQKRRLSQSFRVPVKQYYHQSMKEYLGRLYSRADLKEYLYHIPDQSPAGGGGGDGSFNMTGDDTDDTWDIWDSPALRELLGPDGKTPFIQVPDGESRLVFSINMDGFNPYGNKQAGKKVSVGGIYMVCLNLPPAIRYKIENVYLVGIIPGPKLPSMHEINYILKPLVDDLVDLWTDGIYLTRTARHPRGCRVRCALGPLVCDLPAARQMSGCSHFTSTNFCSECTQTIQDIQNLEYWSWTPRDAASHRQAAWSWRNAATLKEREDIMQTYGARWSELLRLNYWDPIKFTVIDSMHAFFLRLLHHHCRTIWGMDVRYDDGDGNNDSSAAQPSDVEMAAARIILRKGTTSQLSSLKVAIIRELCRNISTVDLSLAKGKLIKELKEYRIRRGWFDASDLDTGSPDRIAAILMNEKLQGSLKEIQLKNTIRSTDDIDDYFQNASKTTIHKLRKADLYTLYLHRVQPHLQLPEETIMGMTIPDLHSRIQGQRQQEGIVDDKGKHLHSSPKKTRVLGKGLLKQISADMTRTSLPTWMPTAPAQPGEAHRGKFSADQWRTFCFQVLPITLIRLWGPSDEDSLERRRLDNFLHLVSAVKLATMRRMTKSRIQAYTTEMHLYLTTLLELYPDVSITPYQHMALHFGQQLERFGPTHSWRCYPFERYNYVMQNLPTNSRFGDLEKTMFDKFLGAQSMRTFFKSGNIPPVLNPLINLFTQIFESDIRGTYRNEIMAQTGEFQDTSDFLSKGRKYQDTMAYDERFRKVTQIVTWKDKDLEPIHQEVYPLLRDLLYNRYGISKAARMPKGAYFHQKVNRLGQRFTTKATSPSDCHVIFSSLENSWSAASITSIFSYVHTKEDGTQVVQTFVLLKEYKSLSPEDSKHDHYRRYPIAGGRVFQRAYHKKPVLVELHQIHSHFASYSFRRPVEGAQEWLLAMPLQKA